MGGAWLKKYIFYQKLKWVPVLFLNQPSQVNTVWDVRLYLPSRVPGNGGICTARRCRSRAVSLPTPRALGAAGEKTAEPRGCYRSNGSLQPAQLLPPPTPPARYLLGAEVPPQEAEPRRRGHDDSASSSRWARWEAPRATWKQLRTTTPPLQRQTPRSLLAAFSGAVVQDADCTPLGRPAHTSVRSMQGFPRSFPGHYESARVPECKRELARTTCLFGAMLEAEVKQKWKLNLSVCLSWQPISL